MTEEELNAAEQTALEQISALRESLNPAYAALGEALYPATHEGELAEQFAEQFSAVADGLAQIAAEEQKIADAREAFEAEQKRIVEEEAARAAEEAAAAAGEGAEEGAEEDEDESAVESAPGAAETRTCPTCGTEIQEGDNFCAGCGAKVSELFATPEPAKIFCPNCGKELEPEMRFCIYCGTKVQQ